MCPYILEILAFHDIAELLHILSGCSQNTYLNGLWFNGEIRNVKATKATAEMFTPSVDGMIKMRVQSRHLSAAYCTRSSPLLVERSLHLEEFVIIFFVACVQPLV